MQIYSPTLTQKLDHIPCFGLCVCEDAFVCVKKTDRAEDRFFIAAVVLDFNILQLTSYKDSALFSQTHTHTQKNTPKRKHTRLASLSSQGQDLQRVLYIMRH